jgi:hypothetical protein
VPCRQGGARRQRPLDGQYRKDIVVNQRREALQFGERELRQVDAEFLRAANGQADGCVGIAERQALAGQVVGQVGGGGKSLAQASRMFSGRVVMPGIISTKMRRVSVTVSMASKSGSLSSWLSLL